MSLEQFVNSRWVLIPLEKGTKKPLNAGWQTAPVPHLDELNHWLSENYNIAAIVPDGICIIDVDTHGTDLGLANDSLMKEMASLGLDPLYATVATPRGGLHFYCHAPENLITQKVTTLAKAPNSTDWVIEVLGPGHLVTMPPSSITGIGSYTWKSLNHVIVDMNDRVKTAILSLQRLPLEEFKSSKEWFDIELVRSALDSLPSDDYNDWVRYGMAIKNSLPGEAGFMIWKEWSLKSHKYTTDAVIAKWQSFDAVPKANRKSLTISSIIWQARRTGWQPPILSEIAKINENHFIVPDGGKVIIYREESDGHLTSFTSNDFKILYSNITILGNNSPKPRPLGSAWIEDTHRRTYRNIGFFPGGREVPDGTYNLWRGWGVRPAQGTWSKLEWHIRHVICEGVPEYYDYFISWCAFMFQNPTVSPEAAIVLVGGKGTGKGFIGRTLTTIAGHHGLAISHPEHLTGRFNGHLRDCVSLFLDEAFFAGDKRHESVLKALITEPTLAIESKHKNVINARNYLHVIISANDDWVVPASIDERRYCIFSVSDEKQGDYQYFNELSHEMQNGGIEAFFYDLMTLDISSFNPRKIPQTIGLVKQKLMSLQGVHRWWLDCLVSGSILGAWGEVEFAMAYADYQEAARRYREYRIVSPVVFTMLLRHVADVTEGAGADGKGRTLMLPSLDVARQSFATTLGVGSWDALSLPMHDGILKTT